MKRIGESKAWSAVFYDGWVPPWDSWAMMFRFWPVLVPVRDRATLPRDVDVEVSEQSLSFCVWSCVSSDLRDCMQVGQGPATGLRWHWPRLRYSARVST